MLTILKKKKSIITSIALLFLVGFIYVGLYFGFIPTILGLEREVAKYNTIYVKGFSWDKMSQVQKGMTPQEVLQILGEPYGGMPDKPFCPSWSYQNPVPWKRIPPLAEDFWWITAQICFDVETNTVSYPGIEHVFFN